MINACRRADKANQVQHNNPSTIGSLIDVFDKTTEWVWSLRYGGFRCVSVTNLHGGSGWDAPWVQCAGTGFTDESIVGAGLTYSTSNAVLET